MDQTWRRSELLLMPQGFKPVICRSSEFSQVPFRRIPAAHGTWHRVVQNDLAPRIIFSGSANIDRKLSEAQVRAQLALTMGVPEHAIIKNEPANTTRGESIRTSTIL